MFCKSPDHHHLLFFFDEVGNKDQSLLVRSALIDNIINLSVRFFFFFSFFFFFFLMETCFRELLDQHHQNLIEQISFSKADHYRNKGLVVACITCKHTEWFIYFKNHFMLNHNFLNFYLFR